MNREEAPGKSPEDMYIQQKVRVLLMLKKMGSNVSAQTMVMWHFKFGYLHFIDKKIKTALIEF